MTLEEDKGIQRTNPRHRRSTRQRRANGVIPLPADSVLGLLTTWQREWGPLRGKWGLSPPFFLAVFFSSFLTQKHTPRTLFFRSFSLYLIHMYNYSVSLPHPLSLSLVSPTLPPPPVICSGICGDASFALPIRDAKNGDTTSGQMTWATPPCLLPPTPPDGFITSYAAHLEPIESLGGRECLTQISTSEGVSATLGNCWLGFGVELFF